MRLLIWGFRNNITAMRKKRRRSKVDTEYLRGVRNLSLVMKK